MISGEVGPDGVVRVRLIVGGAEWPATIDTGFNGDLELPYATGPALRPVFRGITTSMLADGTFIEEESYTIDFPFDGETVPVVATFRECTEILVGTRLLRRHRLEVDFPARTVVLQRP